MRLIEQNRLLSIIMARSDVQLLDVVSSIVIRALVRAGATGAAAPINFWQRVHAPVNFQT